MVARYAIKHILDHEIEYGHYEYLHGLLSNQFYNDHYLNEQERHRIENSIDIAAENHIKRHTFSLWQTKIE